MGFVGAIKYQLFFLIFFLYIFVSCSESKNKKEFKPDEEVISENIDFDNRVLEERLPKRESKRDVSILKRDRLDIEINADNEVLIRGSQSHLNKVKAKVIELYNHPIGSSNLPVITEITIEKSQNKIERYEKLFIQSPSNEYYIDSLKMWELYLATCKKVGTYNQISEGVIVVIQMDNKTSFETYILLLNEIMEGLKCVRNEFSLIRFGIPFIELNDKVEEDIKKIKIIHQIYPKLIMKAKSHSSK